MKKIVFLCTIIVLTLTMSTANAEPIKRHILALLDGDEIQEEADNLIHSYAQTPLEHLGYVVDFVDITKKLPSEKEMIKYHAMISWFQDNKMKNPQKYIQWLVKQLNKDIKLIVLEYFGFSLNDKGQPLTNEELQPFFDAFHVTYNPDNYTTSPLLITSIKLDQKVLNYERSLNNIFTVFENIQVTDPNANVFLKLKRKDMDLTSDAVFVHDKGGFAISNHITYLNPVDHQSRWIINPFVFFSQALQNNFPKPDITTLNGMRIFYSHVDGDGIRNTSHKDNKTLSGNIAYKEIFSHYKLPVSVSVVIGDFILASKKDLATLKRIANKIFSLPNIEIASHGWAHPLSWQKKDRHMAYDLKGFDYSPQNEIGNAIDYIHKYLAPKNKRVKTFFWTGDCKPDEEALKFVYDSGLLNINGGDTRYDFSYPSLTFIAPLFRRVGNFIQFYASNSNENTYTNLWTGPFYGYKNVITTFEKTEAPLRIRPINVYYHFYTMEHPKALSSIKTVYDWVLTQEITPLFTSQYIHWAQGFLSTEIEKLSDSHWKISNNKSLTTLRFDNEKRFIDLNTSNNVLGFMHFQNNLYVFLNSSSVSEIVLSNKKPDTCYLEKANGIISKWNKQESLLSFSAQTIGKTQITLAGLKPNRNYKINYNSLDQIITTTATGKLNIQHQNKTSGFETNTISIDLL